VNALSFALMGKYVGKYKLREEKTVVDVGSYDDNGTYRPLFAAPAYMGDRRYIGADIREGPNVDLIVGSPEWNALKDVDAVISGSTFEHVEDEATLLGQIHDVLKPGGLFCLQAPSAGPAHDFPAWYRNYSVESMTKIVRDAGFDVLSCEIAPDDEFCFCTCVARKNGA
jgi:SAM-dependent methyltransferase